jgi:uncharacterized protein
MDFTLYWFMFPVSICVATTAMLSGIGGAALFTPIFFIIFPILGPEYPLESATAAIGSALLTETFGFSSGFVGYFRKRLIDFKIAMKFVMISVPIAIVGALLVQFTDPLIIKGGYALLMLFLAFEMYVHIDPAKKDARDARRKANKVVQRELTSRDGTHYSYPEPQLGAGSRSATGIGSFLTGLLSVGIGEVVMPILSKRNRVPIPIAAATSVLVVIITIAAASFTHISALMTAGGVSAVPWHLVVYMIPAVIIGGQIGPRLQGSVNHRTMEKAIGILFGIIGLAMVWIVIRDFF